MNNLIQVNCEIIRHYTHDHKDLYLVVHRDRTKSMETMRGGVGLDRVRDETGDSSVTKVGVFFGCLLRLRGNDPSFSGSWVDQDTAPGDKGH